MSAITASVVLYNTPESQMIRLLESIRRSSIQVHLYVVDNSPSPQYSQYLKVSGVTYLRSPSNNGYGAGHNIALRQVLDTAEFHFVLNPDICFEATELEKMLDFMRNDPAIGQLMPRVTYPDGSLQYLCKLLPTPFDLFLRRFAFGPLKELQRIWTERFELRHSGYDSVMDIPYLSGCFMLFRTSALRKVGLFDERYFMYPEDIDMTRRMHVEFRTVFYPGATIVHDHAKESYKSLRAFWVHVYNSVKYFNKWGWFWDAQRSRFNRETMQQIALKSKSPSNAALENDAARPEGGSQAAAPRPLDSRIVKSPQGASPHGEHSAP
jgi:GT2 family glycosyltransferase